MSLRKKGGTQFAYSIEREKLKPSGGEKVGAGENI